MNLTLKTALVVGATGVVGRELVQQLCESEHYEKILVWVRREFDFQHEKLEVKIINFDDIRELETQAVNDIFCALGTTMKQAGSKEILRKVDVDYPLQTALWGEKAGAQRFILLTAPNSNPHSSNDYLRFKGELEEAVKQLNFESVLIVHPPLIDGMRMKNRWLERFAIWILRSLPRSFFPSYYPMTGKEIANAVIKKSETPLKHVEYFKPYELEH